MPGNALHAATKGTIASPAIGSAEERAPEVGGNALASGIIDRPIRGGSPGNRSKVAEIATIIPLRPVGMAEEVAEAALWLLSGASSSVTGTIIDLAGGH